MIMTKYQPLKVYLDSCDYVHLYVARNEWQEELVLYLKDKIKSGEVVVVFSYPVLMEILQDFSPEYKEDRLSRATFVKSLCGCHCFRFFMDCTDGGDPYTDDGDWIPSYINEFLNIDLISSAMVSTLTTMIRSSPIVSMERKRILETPYGLRAFIAALPDFPNVKSSYTFISEFHEKQVIKNYILGNIGKDEANRILMDAFKDPVLFFKNYFDVGEFRNHFTGPVHKASTAIQNGIDELRFIATRSDLAKKMIESVDASTYWENMSDFVPPEMGGLLNAYFADNLNHPHYQRSDIADLLHGLYLPYCDLWRGDRHFSALLVRQKVPNYRRIVPALSDLKNRIESMLKQRD